MVSLPDQMAIQWAKTNCTVESNQLKSEKHFYILKENPFLFDLIAGFRCSSAVVPGISHLAYTHVWPTFLQEVCIHHSERVHQRKRERWEGKILGNSMTGKMIVLAKDFF